MNHEVANLIADEVSVSIDRIAQIANGELVQTPGPLARRPMREDEARRGEALTPGQALTPDAVQTPLPPRIYSVAPNQSAIEFLINHTLGMPGATVEVITTTEDASRRIQGAKERENFVVVKDHSILMLACEQQLKDFLPTAIDRLLELAAGVTVQYMHTGKTFTVTHKPNARSIDYITSRTEGRFASVLTDLRDKFENPDLDYPYTAEDFEKMTHAEREALYECAMRNTAKTTNNQSAFDDDEPQASTSPPPTVYGLDELRSSSPPSTVYGRCSLPRRAVSEDEAERGDGGEGYNVGGVAARRPVWEGYNLPAYIATANKRLADFLPTAIKHLKTLAIGAQTIIDSETEQRAIDFGPDLKANMFFVNRFLGTPPTPLKVETLKPPMTEAELAKLAAQFPLTVAKYGSIEAAAVAASKRLMENRR